MATGKNRRKKKRWQVAVLVRCSIPKFSKEIFEIEMWAKDVNENGMKLEWTRGLSVSHIKDSGETEPRAIRFEDVAFNKGAKILVQDLFYDDDGSPFIEGKILWTRKASTEGSWALGIQFVNHKKQSKALLGAFKDFLSVIKSPNDVIAKASRK